MGQYGEAAVCAVKIMRQKQSKPKDAWFEALARFTKSNELLNKVCPKTTFLALYALGVVKGVKKGNYCPNGRENKTYVKHVIDEMIEADLG